MPKTITLKKISKLPFHQNFKDKIIIRKDYYDITKELMNEDNKYAQLCYMYGEGSSQVTLLTANSDNIMDKFVDYIHKEIDPIIDADEYYKQMRAYDFGPTTDISVGFKLEDIILKDLEDLEDGQIGYIFYHIFKEIKKSGVPIDSMYYYDCVNDEIMKDELLSNSIFGRKYKEIKRGCNIDTILI